MRRRKKKRCALPRFCGTDPFIKPLPALFSDPGLKQLFSRFVRFETAKKSLSKELQTVAFLRREEKKATSEEAFYDRER